MNLAERTNWILIDLIRRYGLTNESFAEKVGCNKNTISNYRRMRSEPNVSFIEKVCQLFPVNPIWYLTGEGSIYLSPDKKEKTNSENKLIGDDDKSQNLLPSVIEENNKNDGEKIKVSEALTMTACVLDSNTTYATALYLNIQHFYRAIKAENETNVLKNNIIKLTQDLDEMKSKFTKLESDYRELLQYVKIKEHIGLHGRNNAMNE